MPHFRTLNSKKHFTSKIFTSINIYFAILFYQNKVTKTRKKTAFNLKVELKQISYFQPIFID